MATGDPELTAMGAVLNALDHLEPDVQARVIGWAAQRYGVRVSGSKQAAGRVATGEHGEEDEAQPQFRHFTDALDAAPSATTEADRALVGGYWFQVIQGKETFTSFEVNNELKNAGHGSKNITDAFTTLQQRKPAHVRQVAKAGRTRQARKTYKLTVAGVRAVEAMIGAPAGGDDDE